MPASLMKLAGLVATASAVSALDGLFYVTQTTSRSGDDKTCAYLGQTSDFVVATSDGNGIGCEGWKKTGIADNEFSGTVVSHTCSGSTYTKKSYAHAVASPYATQTTCAGSPAPTTSTTVTTVGTCASSSKSSCISFTSPAFAESEPPYLLIKRFLGRYGTNDAQPYAAPLSPGCDTAKMDAYFGKSNEMYQWARFGRYYVHGNNVLYDITKFDQYPVWYSKLYKDNEELSGGVIKYDKDNAAMRVWITDCFEVGNRDIVDYPWGYNDGIARSGYKAAYAYATSNAGVPTVNKGNAGKFKVVFFKPQASAAETAEQLCNRARKLWDSAATVQDVKWIVAGTGLKASARRLEEADVAEGSVAEHRRLEPAYGDAGETSNWLDHDVDSCFENDFRMMGSLHAWHGVGTYVFLNTVTDYYGVPGGFCDLAGLCPWEWVGVAVAMVAFLLLCICCCMRCKKKGMKGAVTMPVMKKKEKIDPDPKTS